MTRVGLFGLGLTLCLAAGPSILAAPKAHPNAIWLYIFTAPPPGQFVDLQTLDREETMAHLRDALEYHSSFFGGHTTEVIREREAADVQLEMLRRDRDRRNPEAIAVRVRLTAGDFSVEIVGRDGHEDWKDAADDAANQVRSWVVMNREKLLAQRHARGQK
jgi:hypothetical protein